jgi:hypothetical protein
MVEIYCEGFASMLQEVVGGARDKGQLATAIWVYFVAACEKLSVRQYGTYLLQMQRASEGQVCTIDQPYLFILCTSINISLRIINYASLFQYATL